MSIGRESSSLSHTLCNDQRRRWLAGERVLAEEYVDQHPELRSNPDALFEIIAGEFHLREELGEFPDVSEYALRFPDLSDRLSRLASTARDASGARNLETRAEGAQAPAGLHCRFCGRISRPTEISEAGEVRCEHCQKVLMVVEETTPYALASVAVIGRFELREHVGRGQFGDVWRAYDVDLRREVAVKIPRRMPENKAMHALFVREARAAARLRHPHIVPVYEIGKADDRIYIVSEFIKGTTLKNWLEQREFAPPDAAQLCVTLARAVHHAHQEGIVHRDLKPGNILMDVKGTPHIADFGLAKQSNSDATLTVEGQVLGTPAYMSPEQARGEAHKADRRCDVYSLGVILYELLTRQRPFETRDEVLIYEILNIEPPSPRKKNRAVPPDLETICLTAMAKDPAARYQTAEDLAIDLQRFLAGEPILAKRTSVVRRAWRWSRGRRWQITSAVALAGSLVLTAGSLLGSRKTDVPAALEERAIVLETEPSGATVHFIPLDNKTGEPQPGRRIESPDRSPVRMSLPVSDYLVVTVLDNGRFHEVYRHVPSKEENIPYGYKHRSWKRDPNGVIRLPLVTIPIQNVTDGMARVEGGDAFQVKEGIGIEASTLQVPSFYIDAREYTVGDFRRMVRAPVPPDLQDMPDDTPFYGGSCELVMSLAENAGKRLATEFEYEFAATAGGKQTFPWGDAMPASAAELNVNDVHAATFDRLETTPPVIGLCTGLAEWTVTRPVVFPVADTTDPRFYRVVRGGGLPVVDGDMTVNSHLRNPRSRAFVNQYRRAPGLGFRCVRSERPRLRPEDFVSSRTAAPETPKPLTNAVSQN